jgi:hypothetical protein
MDTGKGKIWHLQSFLKPTNSKRLPGLQNILQAEMMAIHHTLQLLITTYQNEPAHIFTDCLNILNLLNTQIKHPTSHNSHPDKIILENMVKMLISQTQTTTLHKIKAHTNIEGNDQADALAKLGRELDHRDATSPYGHAHPTPYYLQKTGGIPWKKHLTKAP